MAEAMNCHGLSQRRACGLVGITRRSFRRVAPVDCNRELRERLRVLAEERRRWGSPMLYLLLRREGWLVNHKRVERLYREEGLSLRRRRRRKRLSHLRVVRQAPEAANRLWSMDFVSDSLAGGRRFRALTVPDEWSRESLAIEVEASLTGERVTRVLQRLRVIRGGLPPVIQTDNGPEFTSRALDRWAYECGVRIQFIEPGKPVQNAFIESFNGKLRDECLNEHVFLHARRGARNDRGMASRLQSFATAWQSRRLDADRVRGAKKTGNATARRGPHNRRTLLMIGGKLGSGPRPIAYRCQGSRNPIVGRM